MVELTQASREWAQRPADQRYLSLTDMHAHFDKITRRSKENTIDLRSIEVARDPKDYKGLVFRSSTPPIGKAVNPDFMATNWSFNQLASLVKAPPAYLSKLPAAMAAQCLNHGLLERANAGLQARVLIQNASKPDERPTLRAINSEQYGRVWNKDILENVMERFGDGINGDFRVPGEFGTRITVTRENTTLYAGDRDMFIFLADEEHKIELPNRRDGKPGGLSRGFFLWNSEVGATSFGVKTFLFDYACSNRIVWGAEEVKEFRFRHRGEAYEKRFMKKIAPAMTQMANASTIKLNSTLRNAQAKQIGSTQEDVNDFLASFFAKPHVERIKIAHENEEHRPIRTYWDAVTGGTAFAKTIDIQADRVDVETRAGKILEAVE